MNFRILSACNGGILEVFGTGSSVRLPVTDFNLKSSADGTVELNLLMKSSVMDIMFSFLWEI